MPKKIFWPAVLVAMGLIFLASNLGMLPRDFWNLWPIILIVVGLGGLLTSDRDEWLVDPRRTSTRARKAAARTSGRKKTSRATKKK